MSEDSDLNQLSNIEELEKFVSSYLSGWMIRSRMKQWTVYKGIEFRLQAFGMPGAIGALLFGWFFGIVDRVFRVRRGLSIQIRLPRTLSYDLWMESKWQRDPGEFSLDGSFWLLTSHRDEFVRAVSSVSKLVDRIKKLDSVARLLVTDEKLIFGPLAPQSAPELIAELAEDATALARDLSELQEEEVQDEQLDPDLEIPEPSGGQKVVYRCSDSLEAEFVAAQLRKSGIEPRVLGTRIASLLGAGTHIFRLKIVAAESQAEAAKRILDLVSSDPRYKSRPWIDDLDDVIFQKKRIVAFGATFILPGGAHYYVVRPVTGLILGFMILASFFFAVFTDDSRLLAGSLIFLGITVLTDLIGAQLDFTSMKKKRFPGKAAQILRGLILTGLAIALTTALATLINVTWMSSHPIQLPFPYLMELF